MQAPTTAPRATSLEPSAEIKFGQVGIANLKLKRLDPEALSAELADKVTQAARLFLRAPVVLDLSPLFELPSIEVVRDLLARIRAAGMLPVGLSYGTRENEALAEALDLPVIAKFRAAYEPAATAPARHEAPPAPVAAAEPAPEPPPPPAAPATVIGLLHEQPVRSGQQVYARGRDLILGTLVGNGAEVIADGSIHVYGALRGRALAGAQGAVDARIWCREFHAELVSIAGRYRVFEEIPPELRGQPVVVWLEGDKLMLRKL
ncbi:septum site-determining protein MinC [Dokdonella sp.]|uniref:septum site-determining protein MinC n=1 Tax=Dokdonella sp. TaxID=2291710 RepID=UPI0031C457DF|nr:septum site-determining protein MinC [Dokdonella sp.]